MLVKDEAPWIAAHLSAWLPVLDQMVFADGGSKDGTLEILREFAANHPDGHKLHIYHDDPKDLKGDYVRAFNVCLRKLNTDLAFFLHPDMYPSKLPADFKHLAGCTAASTKMRSFAGEGDKLSEIKGRGEVWKNLYRLRNPDLGAHYHGHYGAHNEDVYFEAITGDAYEHHGSNVHWYPYEVVDSGIEILHFSDVRPVERRYSRMLTCLTHQGHAEKSADLARSHPRVTLKDGEGFKFIPAEYPKEFAAARAKYAHLEKTPTHV
jgi:glycosyltransferase involved in cell wall biosynthesis